MRLFLLPNAGVGALVALALSGAAACKNQPNPPEPAPLRPSSPPPTAAPAADAAADDDFVDITDVDASIRVDIRYATRDNFTGVAVYPVARCLLRRPVAQRLARVQATLRTQELGLKVWDCYRPISVQRRFWELVPDRRYVAEVVFEHGTPVSGSKHNRGAAVDVTLVDASGDELEMPTGYDDFTAAAHRDHEGGSATGRANTIRLETHMAEQGFLPLATEWWHFDAPDWESYALSDRPLR